MVNTVPVAKKPWLKITFDPSAPGAAKVLKHAGGHLHTISGRWIVFDKGQSNPLPLFEAETCEECYKFIRKREEAAK